MLYSQGPSALGWTLPWAPCRLGTGWGWPDATAQEGPLPRRGLPRAAQVAPLPPANLGPALASRLAGGALRGHCPCRVAAAPHPAQGYLGLVSSTTPLSRSLGGKIMLTIRHKQEFPVCPSSTWGRGWSPDGFLPPLPRPLPEPSSPLHLFLLDDLALRPLLGVSHRGPPSFTLRPPPPASTGPRARRVWGRGL